MSERQRLSATVESGLLDAARRAVEEGRSASVSAWVNDAMRRQAGHDQRMQALDDFLHDYEAEHGTISDGEMALAAHRVRGRAIAVRDPETSTT